MKRANRLALVGAAVAVLGLFVARAWAAMNVPAGLAYSGVLKSNGAPEAGTRNHSVTFELFDGTSVVCADTRASLAITDGRFDVGDLFSSSCALDAALASRPTLSIRITVDGQQLSPPQPLGTTPYAARARVAETAEALAPSAAPGKARGWVSFNGATCTPACPIFDSFNVTGVTRAATGEYVVSWTTPFGNATYVLSGSCQRTDTVASLMFQVGRGTTSNPLTTGTARVGCGNYDGNPLDSGLVHVVAFGH